VVWISGMGGQHVEHYMVMRWGFLIRLLRGFVGLCLFGWLSLARFVILDYLTGN